MFRFVRPSIACDAVAKLDALNRSLASIEFDLSGKILTANGNFLALLGYSLNEVCGQHHSMFIDSGYRETAEYQQFWEKLRSGEHQVAQFKRLGKGSKEIWIEASYNPIFGADGKPYKIVKYATDITARKLLSADFQGQIDAIQKSQAVIEFSLDGTILSANENFLNALGYKLDEVCGKHHSMFVDPVYRESAAYRNFWGDLRQGQYKAEQFKRYGNNGKVVWIEASYNPILDQNGKPFKVVKYATDITNQIKTLSNLKTLIDSNFSEIEDAVSCSFGEASRASDAVHTTTANIQTMAASAEELAASVREIATMMAESRSATETAHSQTAFADEATQRLAATSDSMTNIVSVIRDIAGRINLLALNATIESARAGEAGKGFAVVAGEVKNLAQQAANATSLITSEIAKMQKVSAEVVTALGTIGKSIDDVRQFVAGTASAVEEQSVVTQGMSADMQSAAAGVMAINDNMTGITAAVGQVGHTVDSTKAAAQVLVR